MMTQKEKDAQREEILGLVRDELSDIFRRLDQQGFDFEDLQEEIKLRVDDVWMDLNTRLSQVELDSHPAGVEEKLAPDALGPIGAAQEDYHDRT
jgi:hypothetical protein